jgi:hypothetical protein
VLGDFQAKCFGFSSEIAIVSGLKLERHDVCLAAYVFHSHMRADDLCGVVITDEEYQPRVSFSLIMKVCDRLRR